MLYAVYRALYGHDFFEASVKAIADVADKIIVVMDSRPYPDGVRPMVYSKAHRLMEEAAKDYADHVHYWHYSNPVNQYTDMVERYVKRFHGIPDELMCLDVDHVFRTDHLWQALTEFRAGGYRCADTRQVEVWRGFKHRVPERPQRAGVTLWNMRGLSGLPDTAHLARTGDMQRLQAFVHNLGFAVSPETMKCKHEISCANTQDSMPNPDWYEKKWLNWTPDMKDLEISAGYEHDIPYLEPYDPKELPEAICDLL